MDQETWNNIFDMDGWKVEFEDLKQRFPDKWKEASKFIKPKPEGPMSEKESVEFQMSNEEANRSAIIRLFQLCEYPINDLGQRYDSDEDI